MTKARSTSFMAISYGLSIAVLSIAGCGGGSSDPAPAVVAPTTTAVAVTVVDGAIRGATVCLDKNGNGVCDSDEPSGVTDASGATSLTVANADVGKFPVLVTVGTDAVDADTGAVPTAYIMQAPADQAAVVSPLTTLVEAQIATNGGTTAQAAAFVQAQTGLNGSLFNNYTATRATSPDAAAAANLARTLVVITQQQLTTLAAVVGQTDLTGAVVTKLDLQRQIGRSLTEALPALASAARDPSVSAATTATARDAVLNSLVTALVAKGQAGLTTDVALAAIGVSRLPVDATAVPTQPTATLRMLRFTDVNNWFFRAMESTAADNTPDVNGLVRYYDNRTQDVAGTLTTWGFNGTYARRGDLHWNGSAWVGCAFGTRSSQTVRNAAGISQYNYCDSAETGSSQRATVDVSGKTLASVVATIRAFPGIDSNLTYAGFGPTDTSVLGTATFPAGSSLYYQTGQTSTEALSYDVTSVVSGYAPDIAAGGNAAATPPAACNVVTVANSATYFHPVLTLEGMIAAAPGHPCVFGTTTNGHPMPNEWWGVSTINIGAVAGGLTPPDPVYFSTTEFLRVAFNPTGTVAIYLSCLARASDGSPRNCTELGRGTYTIQTLGDARVMTLNNPPPETLRVGYTRVFVERGGTVYFGYQNLPGFKSSTVRLNLPAANALLGQLGIPSLSPN